ncbi:MAG TPA: hypothetical protein VJR30_04760 [Bradyrhizobium sp.]|nr:hypothetical protein [Bradyrhizobium sp.]
MPLDNFHFGPVNAASHVPSLSDILGDHARPGDPYLPPNPIFGFSPASVVHAALHFTPVFTDSAQHDLLI